MVVPDRCKETLILFLNIFTGGLGTILSPFIFDDDYDHRKIIIAVFLGCIQILHFVHILSIIIGFDFINNFYDIIGGENILKPFMSDKYKNFLNITKNISETIDHYIPDDINEGISSINPNEIIPMNSRVSFLKIIILVISGLSYINSSLSPLINLIKNNQYNFKMLTYGIFNPGAGILISAILFFNDERYYKIIVSLIGVLFGILLMFCPYLLGAGLYLVKVIYNIINLFYIKIILIYIGALGTIFSILFSVLQNNLNNSSFNEIGIFDIDFILCSDKYNIKSKISIGGIIRLIANIILSGSGILSLLCKYGCNIGIFIIGIIELGGVILLLVVVLGLYNESIEHSNENNKEGILVLFGYLFFTLSIRFCGNVIIIISEYFPKKPEKYNDIGIFLLTFLNVISGGFGTLISIDISPCCENKCGNCILAFLKIIWSIIGIGSYIYFIMAFFLLENNIMMISLIGWYCFYSFLSFCFLRCGKNKKESTNIEISTNRRGIHAQIYNNYIINSDNNFN